MITGESVPVEALLIRPARVRGEQDSAGPKTGAKLREHPLDLLPGHVEEGRVGEDPVEALLGQIEGEEVLNPDFAPALLTRRGHERLAAVEPDGRVAEFAQGREIPTRPAAEVEDVVRGHAGEVREQRVDVLRDVVVASSPPEAVRSRFVVGQRDPADFAKLVVGEGLHGGTMPEREEIRTQGPGGQGPAWSRRKGLDGRIGTTLRAHAEGRRDIVDRW